jgi:hypothetical protein
LAGIEDITPSSQISIVLFAPDTTCENNFTAFSAPYNTSVLALSVLLGGLDKLQNNVQDYI